jgi:hypothetical protein
VIAVALIVAVAVAFAFGRRAKVRLEVFAALATGFLMVFVVSEIPGSPTSCLHGRDACQHSLTGLVCSVFIAPLAVWAVIDHLKRRRGL